MDKTYATDTCKIGQGKDCCRYLVADMTGLQCAKLTVMKHLIDDRASRMVAQGDHCVGIEEPDF